MDDPDEVQMTCSLDNIQTCPSVRNLKVLLKRMDQSIQSVNYKSDNKSENEPQSNPTFHVMESLKSVVEEHEYSATKLLDDLHHLQYDHDLNKDDTKFDAAYEFFTDSSSGKGCDVNECPFMMRHYRVRGREDTLSNEAVDNVLMDTMAQIHCYFLHSFDTNRLTKEERDRMEMELSAGIGLDSLDEEEDPVADLSDDDDDVLPKRVEKINEIVTEKRQKLRFGRDDRRYRDNDDDNKSIDDQSVDIPMMAQSVGIEAVSLKQELNEYEEDMNQLIGDLIDVVYVEDATTTAIWSKLEMDNDAKIDVFRSILHRFFKITQLNTDNLIRASNVFIGRKRLEIDIDVLIDVITTNGINGRMFDKTAPNSYENCGNFAKRFKGLSGCKLQHVRQLYTTLRKWKYVEPKKEVVEEQENDVEDGKEDEKEAVDDDGDDQQGVGEPDVYEIGRRFYFWDSHRKHPDYVAPKYKNMKEEVLDNPLLAPLTSIGAWNSLTAIITALLATEKALSIRSNGQSVYMYGIRKSEPLEAQHLRSLKLYTDFTELCAKFCATLRWADPAVIAGIAHWVRNLVETVQCFGSSLGAESAQKTYYRGVDRAFIFKMIATRFNLPLSTTSDVK